jgi:DNA modification methylase
MPGTLIHGDNLAELRKMSAGSVDLVYADPPFRTGEIFRTSDGTTTYSDRWAWTAHEEALISELAFTPGPMPSWLLRTLIPLLDLYRRGPDGAYLVQLAVRLLELHRVLTSTGVIVLHVDDRMSHLVRVLLDVVFGRDAFVNEIVWRYRRWPAPGRHLQRMHDVLLVYALTPDRHTFHALHGYEPLAESTQRVHGTNRQQAVVTNGKRVGTATTDDQSAGPALSDVWGIPVLAPNAHERTGYPTQKPEALLERVVLTFSNEGDTVLDPYCGSGTTLAVAEKFVRTWVGMDASGVAIETTIRRLGAAVRDVRSTPNRQERSRHALHQA